MDPQTFTQCSAAALRAFKTIPDAKPHRAGSFINIRQRANEACLDFIDRLQEAIQRQIENQDVADALLLQLAFENDNNDCKAVLQPMWLTTTDDGQFIKACQNVGMEQHKAVLLATALKVEIKCYNCGKAGHTRRECHYKNKKLSIKDCPRCHKGNHWANQCRSTYYKDATTPGK